MVLKKYLLCGCLISSILAPTAVVSASDVSDHKTLPQSEQTLTPEQVRVLEDANKLTITEQVLPVEKGITTSAFLESKRYVARRGSTLAFSEGIVDWTYNSSQITNSSAHQESGYVFPNLVNTYGISKQTSSAASYHIYLSKSMVGAGTVTPWGDVTLYKTEFADYIRVNKDGSASIS